VHRIDGSLALAKTTSDEQLTQRTQTLFLKG
jgi:hypothetical protein